MKRFLCAAGFLTAVPLGGRQTADERLLARSVVFFSTVGGLLGGALALLARLLHGPLAPLPAAALTVSAWALLTGGLHLDGLADTADGFGAGGTVKRRLEIMKDSRIGTFGAAAVCMALVLKTALAAELVSRGLYAVLIAAPAVGRAVMVLAIPLFPPARKTGLGRTFKRNVRVPDAALCAAVAAAIALVFQGALGLAAAVTAAGCGLLAAQGINRGLGGLTGDSYGALCEGSEIAALLFLLLFSGGA